MLEELERNKRKSDNEGKRKNLRANTSQTERRKCKLEHARSAKKESSRAGVIETHCIIVSALTAPLYIHPPGS